MDRMNCFISEMFVALQTDFTHINAVGTKYYYTISCNFLQSFCESYESVLHFSEAPGNKKNGRSHSFRFIFHPGREPGFPSYFSRFLLYFR